MAEDDQQDSVDAPEVGAPEPALFVVAIGASAGGLEAIRDLVANLPTDFRAAYVVLQHLSPKHKSLLTTLIDRETRLTVVDAEDDALLEANKIYVAPPNYDMTVDGGRLKLRDPSPNLAAPKPSVDRFFISLAEEMGADAVGVILSGTGSDGSYGVRAIHGAGGITIAQDDQSAKYDGMPVAAVGTGCVDLVLTPREIGTHLAKILSSTRSNLDQFRHELAIDNPISDLLQILLAHTRVDFREYKQTTVQRRIERRMAALGISDQDDYTGFCRSNPAEVDALFKDLMISVTSFFRDQSEFDAVRSKIEEFVAGEENRTYRVWVPACATGEEVYSIAILFAEALGGLEHVSKQTLQIFATDIDAKALSSARKGVYPISAISDMSPDFIDKYFRKFEDAVRVHPQLQEVVVYSEHNVFQDPPFSNIDLISCRNLLIYFNTTLQQKVLTRLHYALRPAGILFLGKAESTTGVNDLFRSAVDGAQIYAKRLLSAPAGYQRRLQNAASPDHAKAQTDRVAARLKETADRAMFDALVRSFDAPALLVSEDHHILRVFGDVSGLITLNETSRLRISLDMLKTPLMQEARTLVNLSLRNKARRRGVTQTVVGHDNAWVMETVPLTSELMSEPAALLFFHEVSPPEALGADTSVADASQRERIAALEQEVSISREAHQYTVEELETSNEELQSLNEEMQSSNEELQATNEELETSNEELQSTNEELITVNEELQINSAELTALHHEFESLLQRVSAAILFVDGALRVTRASAKALEMFRLGRPNNRPHISQCALPPGFPSLTEICNDAIQQNRNLNRVVESEDRRYVLTCAPFTDVKERLNGAMVILSDASSEQAP